MDKKPETNIDFTFIPRIFKFLMDLECITSVQPNLDWIW